MHLNVLAKSVGHVVFLLQRRTLSGFAATFIKTRLCAFSRLCPDNSQKQRLPHISCVSQTPRIEDRLLTDLSPNPALFPANMSDTRKAAHHGQDHWDGDDYLNQEGM